MNADKQNQNVLNIVKSFSNLRFPYLVVSTFHSSPENWLTKYNTKLTPENKKRTAKYISNDNGIKKLKTLGF